MKNEKLKDVLALTLQHIQQTNEFLSSLISMIQDIEGESPPPPPPPVIITTPKEEYPEYLSTDKAAQFIGFSRAYVYRLVHNRKIPCYRPTGKHLLFKKSELEAFLLHGRQATSCELSDVADEILNNRERRGHHYQRAGKQQKKL